MENTIKYTEEDALEALENGDEQKSFDIYMQLIEEIDYEDVDEDGYFSFEAITCSADYPSFKDYNGKITFRTWVHESFTESHRKQLKRAIEDQLESLYEGEWVWWDMTNHPNSYLPD